jgi:pSer/pThr/pTyr-binding forkhead associated (FHA) protein
MRLSFANGEHADFVVDGGAVSLGYADGNTVVLASRDVAPWHARMTVDPRGAVLEVLDPNARTHVNARPVREKALLRCGDVLCLGKVTIALKADRDDVILTSVPAESAAPPAAAAQPARVILRGVSGIHFGKTIAVNHRLLIGRDPASGLLIDEARVAPRHAVLEHVGEAIYLREIDGSGGMFVNGVAVRNAIVHPGDQLAFERNHFIVEAPGLPLRGDGSERGAHGITQTFDAIQHDDIPPSPPSQNAIWWLIGAAAAIAGVIALMIWRGA